MNRRLLFPVLMVVALVATGFLILRFASLHETGAADKVVSGSMPAGIAASAVPAQAMDEVRRRAVLRAGVPAVADPARQNALAEARFITAGSLNGEAAISALAIENFSGTVSAFRAVAAGDASLIARNDRLQHSLADALKQVDDQATLGKFACTRSLCVMEVQAAGDRRDVDYLSFLQEEIDRDVTGIYTSVHMADMSNGMTSSRAFFSVGPAIRSVLAPSSSP